MENEEKEPNVSYGGPYSYADYLTWTKQERFETIKRVFSMLNEYKMKALLVLITLLFSFYTKAQNLYVLSHDTMQVIKVGEKDLIKVVINETDTLKGTIECFRDSIRISNTLVAIDDIKIVMINSRAKRSVANTCYGASALSMATAGFTALLLMGTYPVDMGETYLLMLGLPIGGLGYLISKKYKKHYNNYIISSNGWQLMIN